MVLKDFYQNSEQRIAKQQKEIDSLRQIIAHTGGGYATDNKLRNELKVVFPEVKRLALSRTLMLNVDSNRIDTVVFAIVQTQPAYNETQTDKLKKWLSARMGEKQVRVVRE